MKTLLSLGVVAGLILLCGEFTALTLSVVLVKGFALALVVACGRALPRYMTAEELNEEV